MCPLFLGFRPSNWTILVKSNNERVWSSKTKVTQTFMNVVIWRKKYIYLIYLSYIDFYFTSFSNRASHQSQWLSNLFFILQLGRLTHSEFRHVDYCLLRHGALWELQTGKVQKCQTGKSKVHKCGFSFHTIQSIVEQ